MKPGFLEFVKNQYMKLIASPDIMQMTYIYWFHTIVKNKFRIKIVIWVVLTWKQEEYKEEDRHKAQEKEQIYQVFISSHFLDWP